MSRAGHFRWSTIANVTAIVTRSTFSVSFISFQPEFACENDRRKRNGRRTSNLSVEHKWEMLRVLPQHNSALYVCRYTYAIYSLSLTHTTVSGLIRIFPALPSHCTKIWNDRPSTFRSSQSLYYSYQPFHPNPFWKSTINQLGGVVFFLYQHSSSTLRGAPAILIQSGFFFIFLFREVLAGGRKAEDLFSPFYYCTL